VIISPSGENMADLYNGYIYAEMVVNFENLNQPILSSDATNAITWVGFKDSFDAIEKYEILANGISIYTQNNAIEESYIMNCASTDNMRECDVYSKVIHEHIWNLDYYTTCGTQVNWSNPSNEFYWNKPHTIKLKIDIRHFLPLSNVKYLPAFVGKIELKLFFGTAGLVCANADPARIIEIEGTEKLPSALDTYRVSDYVVLPEVTSEFVQIGEPIRMVIKDTKPVKENIVVTLPATSEPGSEEEDEPSATKTIIALTSPGILDADYRIITVRRDYKITICETLINVFGLYHELYESLKEKYTHEPLNYPTQILQVTNMSSVLNSTSSKASQTITPRFVDSIFLLFPLRNINRSVYKNPLFNTFQLTCASYGSIPSSAFGTKDEPRFIEMCSNAVNLNTDSVGMSKAVLKSLLDNGSEAGLARYSYDTTNFFIGLPTETDNTFQQGQTSDTPINYELSVTMNADNYYRQNCVSPPLMCLLLDSVLSIQVNPYGSPLVALGPNDVTTPVKQ
jgi:hypothetical protein